MKSCEAHTLRRRPASLARGFSSIPDRKVRISTVPGEWREVLECEHCDAQGECEVEVAVPDYIRGGYLTTTMGECPVCEGRGYVELPEDIDAEE